MAPSYRFIPYGEAESLCSRLGEELHRHLGPELRASRFVACPRGGFIVLGMLSYLLDLVPEQIEVVSGETATTDEAVVVVDDCAISGARCAAMIESLSASRIVFAHLLSHPSLRRALVETETRVEAALAAEDLRQRRGSESAADGDPAEWFRHLPGRRYWLGAVEPIAFAWTEPCQVRWNSRTEKLEDDWHGISPRRCLKLKAALGPPYVETATGSWDLAPHVWWRAEGERVVLWNSESDLAYELTEVAAAMWRELLRYGDPDHAADNLASLYDVDPCKLRRDLWELAADLRSRGLLLGSDGAGDRG